jgi:mono/diheme cytochrome c family protein
MELRTLSSTFVFLVLLVACSSRREDSKRAGAEANDSPPTSAVYAVSAVTGPNWLKHLGLNMSQTHMGQMGGAQSIPATPRREPQEETTNGLRATMRKFLPLWRSAPSQSGEVLNEPFVLAGVDLYRLNCRSCHGPNGEGSPPEINSLIGPVQAASRAMIQRRMQTRGTEISDEMAKEMAAEAEKSLRERLQNGGKKMPAFNHLRGDEVEALLAYLDQLADVPAGNHVARLVSESAARVGEHMVKGTCHICHDATGPGEGHMAMMRGITPSLASLPEEQSLSSITHQVQNGSSGMMMTMGGPQMPSFPYFTEEEIGAAYFYLEKYPPRP